MTNRERLERCIEELIESNPEFTERLSALFEEHALDESKHLVGRSNWSYRDKSLARIDKRFPHQARDREEKKTKEALAAAIGAVHLVGGMSQRLLSHLAQAERYYRRAEAAGVKGDSYNQQLLMSKYASTLQAARDALRANWKKSYQMGLQSGGLSKRVSRRMSPSEVGWLRRATRTELSFFDKMIDDVRQGKPLPSLKGRINMYGKAILAAFTAGQVAATGPNTIIHWLLDPEASHCEDCLALSNAGPFLKDTLPTTPRAGLCRCRSNCKCRLVFESVSSKVADVVRQNNYSKKYLLDRIRRGDSVRRKG